MKKTFLLPTLLTFSLTFSYAQEKKGFVFAKMETENAKLLKNETPDSIQIISSKKNLSAIYFHPEITKKLHHKFRHGHGYVYQSSKEEALNSLNKKTKLPRNGSTPYNYTITENNFITTALNDVDTNKIEENILLLEAYRTRYHFSSEANEAVMKMKEVWEELITEYNRNDISVTVIDHENTPMKSLILTINGNEYPDEHVIIGGHIDSLTDKDLNDDNVDEDEFLSSFRSPGADDNASGIATITEILRVLLKNNFKPQRTVEIMAYAAEEIGLVGSGEIAKKYKSENKNVIGYIQFDMTNYKGSEHDVYIYTDEFCDVNLNNFLIQLMETYNRTGLHQFTYDKSRCGYGCSDHFSWYENEYAATLPGESTFSESNPYIHTEHDTYENMGNNANHAAKFAKLGIEYVVEAAKQSNSLATEELNNSANNVYVSNKNLHYKFNTNKSVSFFITDASGRRIINKQNVLSTNTINLSHLNNGFYIAVFEIGNGKTVTHKFVIK